MASSRPTVMIVEDEPDHIHILTEILTRAGYAVVTAFGGEDAFRKVKARPPEIVLTDLAMPIANGVQLIDALKSDPETERIPVIAVTAHIWDGIARAAKTAGCNGFVSKPFKKEDLLAELAKHIAAPPEVKA